MEDDTIVAVATPPGRGGIGVIRMSGVESHGMARRLSGWSKPSDERRATVARLVGQAGEHLDEAVVTLYRAPHSYSGEDMAEISCHGNPLILNRVVERCLALGARPARPGEFTLRAVVNGRIDLPQAEAVVDMIEARSDAGLGLALSQLAGQLSSEVRFIRTRLVDLLAHLTALVEFSEDDIPTIEVSEIAEPLREASEALDGLLVNARQGQILQHGVSIAIVGPPNAGKSSILNRLLGRDRAIVTAIPGTTRDTLEEELTICGLLFRVIDTAGMTQTSDEVEAIGIARSREALSLADLVLLVVDGSKDVEEVDDGALSMVAGRAGAGVDGSRAAELIVAVNKEDLAQQLDTNALRARFPDATIVHTSALTVEGIDELRLLLPAVALRGPVPEGFVLTNQRHVQAISASRASLAAAASALDQRIPLDLVSLDIRSSIDYLGHVLGVGLSDDVFDRVFSRFCIGK